MCPCPAQPRGWVWKAALCPQMHALRSGCRGARGDPPAGAAQSRCGAPEPGARPAQPRRALPLSPNSQGCCQRSLINDGNRSANVEPKTCCAAPTSQARQPRAVRLVESSPDQGEPRLATPGQLQTRGADAPGGEHPLGASLGMAGADRGLSVC